VLGKFMPDRIRQRERLFASDHVTNDGTDFSRESKPEPPKGPLPSEPLFSVLFLDPYFRLSQIESHPVDLCSTSAKMGVGIATF